MFHTKEKCHSYARVAFLQGNRNNVLCAIIECENQIFITAIKTVQVCRVDLSPSILTSSDKQSVLVVVGEGMHCLSLELKGEARCCN